MKSRWIIVAIALVAASAFAVSVWAGRWWSIGDVEIGPFGSKQCFGGDCRPTSLTWIGGSERWMRMGMATWAGGLIAMLVLLVVAGGVAAKRIPRLAARTALIAIGTAVVAGIAFVMQYPGVDGARVDRGMWLFGGAVVLGSVAAIGVLRARIPAAVS
ncbi:MAG: hypothetical protein IPQ07_00945 [Myxococcales bacterium]|nr:hypothetical protein [Myxococcales bacterium]